MAMLAVALRAALTAVAMTDVERKTAILLAEQEFERKENLSRALAETGVTLVGGITSPPPAPAGPPDAPDETPD